MAGHLARLVRVDVSVRGSYRARRAESEGGQCVSSCVTTELTLNLTSVHL